MGTTHAMIRFPQALVVLALFTGASPAAAEEEISYPIIFTDMADLQELGLSLDWPPKLADDNGKAAPVNPPKFDSTCYWYAGSNTNYLLSFSDEFLAAHQARGFTRESLCMALVSEALFDPETGKRLPTYIYRDEGVMQQHLEELNPDRLDPQQLQEILDREFKTVEAYKAAWSQVAAGQIDGLSDEAGNILIPYFYATDELPLRVPNCFKNGTPFADCNWRYDLKTGKKLSAAQTKRIRRVGELAAEAIEAEIARGTGKRMFEYADLSHEAYLLIDRAISPVVNVDADPSNETVEIPVTEDEFNDATVLAWYAASPNLPRGYGYALNAFSEGFGDGGVSVSSLMATFDAGRASSKLSVSRLKALWK
jgi:hypothetical protein